MTEPEQPGVHRGGERTLVVGVDGSVHSRSALKWAADEAVRRGSALRIICSPARELTDVPAWYQSGPEGLSPEGAIVDDAVGLTATRHPSLLAQGQVVVGVPAQVLSRESQSAELLVVGARGRGGFKDLLLGSVSDQCVQHGRCPVAVVHSDGDESPRRPADRIVVGVDGSLGSTRALRWALEEARVRSGTVEAVFAWHFPSLYNVVKGTHERYESASDEILDASREYAEQLAPGVPFAAGARMASTVSALLDASRDATLLVVGSRGHGEFPGALLGSVAHRCVRHADCTVIVVRPGDVLGPARTG